MVSIKKLTPHCCCSYDILAYHCHLIYPSWIFLSRPDKTKKTCCFFFLGGGGGSSYMVLPLISLLKNAPNCPKKAVYTKIHAHKKIVKGRSNKKSFYIIFFEIIIKNLGSEIQMVGKPKCWRTIRNVGHGCPLDNFYFKPNFECSNLPQLSCL